MTEQEAIKKLRLLNELIVNNPNVLDVAYSKNELFGFKVGLSLAIEALQKQAPMKPKISRGKFMHWYNCSACKGWLKGSEKFCNCGQHIDWSDEND